MKVAATIALTFQLMLALLTGQYWANNGQQDDGFSARGRVGFNTSAGAGAGGLGANLGAGAGLGFGAGFGF